MPVRIKPPKDEDRRRTVKLSVFVALLVPVLVLRQFAVHHRLVQPRRDDEGSPLAPSVRSGTHDSNGAAAAAPIAKCGEELPELLEKSDVVTNVLDLIRNNPPGPEWPESHHKGDVLSLLRKQSCLYDVLARWHRLATTLGLRWAVHGGSAMGAKCSRDAA